MVFEESINGQHGNYGLVLEYMEFDEMIEYIEIYQPAWESKLLMIRDVSHGLCYLHSQNPPVIHGDLKIRNVLISGEFKAKVRNPT